MQYTEEDSLDEFAMNDLLYHYLQTYEIEWADPEFLELLLDAAYGDLKTNEEIEAYEQCHRLKHFMLWAKDRF